MGPRRYNRLNMSRRVILSLRHFGIPTYRHYDCAPLKGDMIGSKSLTGQLKAYFEQKDFGQLVQLGYDVTAFTPAAYQRPRLGRPSWRSHLAAGFVLRCVQRLSDPDLATLRCTWRYNR